MVAPFGSCGKPDSCFPALGRRFDSRTNTGSFAANHTKSNHASSKKSSAPTQASPPSPGYKKGRAYDARDLSRGGLHGGSQIPGCHEQQLPDSCCAPGKADAFSCIMVPQSAALTEAVDLQWRCLPTAPLPARKHDKGTVR